MSLYDAHRPHGETRISMLLGGLQEPCRLLSCRYSRYTVMFLQLVAGGHLLLFTTRTERWFFLPPFPAAPLFVAIVLTQIVAVLMCAFGWLVPAIPWTLIGWVWAYNIAWMFVLGAVRLITERFATYRTVRQARSVRLVSQALQPQAPA
jgi:H+-transporting ATPase